MRIALQGFQNDSLILVTRTQFLIYVGPLAHFHCELCCSNIERLVPLMHAADSPPVKMLQLIHTAIYLSRIRIRFLLRSNAPIVVQEGIDSCTVRADHSRPWKHICCAHRSLSGHDWTTSENEISWQLVQPSVGKHNVSYLLIFQFILALLNDALTSEDYTA
jgi:hypothetical protein